jgi:uncharacterized BrkB/YihY/UPF0761 family membrane protein
MKRSKENEPLSDAVTHVLEECRMVLPGIQTLFGFQLIAVFNSTFRERLSSPEQDLHLVAKILNNELLGLLLSAILLVVFVMLWFVLPRVRFFQKLATGE